MEQLVCRLMTLGLVASGACNAPERRTAPSVDPNTLDDLRFTHYLATAPVVTVDEGLRAILLVDGPTGQWPSYQERLAELERRGLVRSSWKLTPNQLLNKGTLAFMLRRQRGEFLSIAERLSEPTGLGDRRYAFRASVSEGTLRSGVPNDPVTGGELLTAINQETRGSNRAAKRGT